MFDLVVALALSVLLRFVGACISRSWTTHLLYSRRGFADDGSDRKGAFVLFAHCPLLVGWAVRSLTLWPRHCPSQVYCEDCLKASLEFYDSTSKRRSPLASHSIGSAPGMQSKLMT